METLGLEGGCAGGLFSGVFTNAGLRAISVVLRVCKRVCIFSPTEATLKFSLIICFASTLKSFQRETSLSRRKHLRAKSSG